jgi:hypothetical protein
MPVKMRQQQQSPSFKKECEEHRRARDARLCVYLIKRERARVSRKKLMAVLNFQCISVALDSQIIAIRSAYRDMYLYQHEPPSSSPIAENFEAEAIRQEQEEQVDL